MASNTNPNPNVFFPNAERYLYWIAGAFAAYWVLFATSAFTGHRQLNSIGAVLILAVLAWGLLDCLWMKVDAVVMASLAAALIPLVSALAGGATQSPEAILKYVSLCFVMAMARLLPLPVVSGFKSRWMLALPIVAILIICVTVDPGSAWDSSRRAGLFVNPNNLALIPFLLLFLIDERRDSLAVRISAHLIVIAVLVFSGTSGAMIAYTIGLTFHLRAHLLRTWRALATILALVGGLAAIAYVGFEGDTLVPETRVLKQLSLMRNQFQNAVRGDPILYYQQERMLGPGATSGVWRIAHWRRTIVTYLDGTPVQELIGFGTGSSPALLGKLPHNEYLRVLFEQGMAGFVLLIFAWRRVLTTAPAGVRYIGLIVAIYSFSENNLDNFPFMALFVLFLSARSVGRYMPSPPVRRAMSVSIGGAQ